MPTNPQTFLTINQAIAKLQAAASSNNPIGGDAVVYLCITDLEYIPVTDLKLDADENGAVMLVIVPETSEEAIAAELAIEQYEIPNMDPWPR